jgi:hypothetical protein
MKSVTPPRVPPHALASHFPSPPSAYRGKPLWSWNSQLDPTELRRQVGVLADMGLGGFFMHGRTGLATEYMGKDWLAAVKTCTLEAQKKGLESWLYDEDRWPSGAAGGLATRNPKFRMRYLRCEVLTARQFDTQPLNRPLALFAATVHGLDLLNYRRLIGRVTGLHPGECYLRFSVETVQPHSFFNGGTYLNTLDPKATAEFLRITHERYQKKCGSQFGKTIPGIFTDEPHHGFVMCDTPKGWLYPPDSGWATPWTEGFHGKFTEAFGYDLIARLPELFLRLHGQKLSPVKWHYMELLHRLFLDGWARPIFEWCNRHHLRLTGHLLAEDLPGDQSITCGSVLRYYELMETPGMDQLLLNNHKFWMAKQVASSARQMGRKGMLSELYGVTGWQLDFDGHKEIGDWQAFLGINLRCHHLAWYSMAGESKRDFPASIFFQSAWYREYRAVEDYYARIHLLMQQGEAVCDTLVLHPVESVWAQVHARWAKFILNQSPDIAPIDRTFASVFRWLTGDQIDFDYGDEEQLSRLGRIHKKPTTPELSIGKGRYRNVVVAGMVTMRASTLQLLEKFRAAGGQVIFAGPAPTHLDALPSKAPALLGKQSIRVALARKPLVAALRKASPPKVRVSSGKPSRENLPLILQKRQDGKSWTIALCNTDASREFPKVTVAFDGPTAQVQEWDCRTGLCHAIPFLKKNRGTQWTTSLSRSGERLFRIVSVADKALQVRPTGRKARLRPVKGPFAYQMDEPNVFVFDRFDWRSGSGRWHATEDILSIDRKLREAAGLPQRGHGMMQPWARPASAAKGPRTPLTLRTRFTVRDLPEGPLHLLLEQPERWSVSLNGKELPTTRDDGWFVDPCFRKIALPPGMLRKGANELVLTADFREGLDLEAVYLLGDFGVYARADGKPAIARPPARLKVGDICQQGFPHYTGRIRYQLPLHPTRSKTRKIHLPSIGGAVATLGPADGSAPVVLPFQPRETDLPGHVREVVCEVVLTRRNLFGPLHLLPKIQDAITPASFRTSGQDYSSVPQLFPSGLLSAPLSE